MRTPRTAPLVVALFIGLACAKRDTSITHGADGTPEWSRHLAAAVPVGISADSARRVMEGNGFSCREGADSVAYLWCDKRSDKAMVQRRWEAVVKLDAQRRVYEVRGSTDLIGP
jgi:type II secretory pathway component PulK